MALNIFGALGNVGRLLPGYVQGQRQAVQDNWQDLQNYNQVQQGQIQNAFDEVLFNPRVAQGYDQAALSRLGVYNQGMQSNINRAAYPAALANASIQSYYQPYLSTTQNLAQLGQGLGLANQYWNPQAMNYWGNPNPYQQQQQYAPWGNLGAAMMQPGYQNLLAQQQSLGSLMLPSIVQ